MRNKTYNLNLLGLKLTGASAGTIFLVVLLYVPVVIFLNIGAVMIMFGVVHSYWDTIPAFSFWQSFGILVLARLLTGSSK